MGEKRFELDLTNAQVPAWWLESELPLKIPMKLGAWDCDLDIDDPELNQLAHRIPHIVGAADKPVGVHFENIPVGAILKRLPDTE